MSSSITSIAPGSAAQPPAPIVLKNGFLLRNALFPLLQGKELAITLRVCKQWKAEIASKPELSKAVSAAKEAVYSASNSMWGPDQRH